jgi:hypothetical protein
MLASGGAGGGPSSLGGRRTYGPENLSATAVAAASTESDIFTAMGVAGGRAFQDKILAYQATVVANGMDPTKATIPYCGAICMQEIILSKLEEIKKRGGLTAPLYAAIRSKGIDWSDDEINARLSYFKSNEFIAKFMSMDIPARTTFVRAESKGMGGEFEEINYSGFLNSLFNTSYDNWRNRRLSTIDNGDQCARAMYPNFPDKKVLKAAQIQDNASVRSKVLKGTLLNCYICGRAISPWEVNSRMECEHKLAILTALVLWWLVKLDIRKLSKIPGFSKFILAEYGWSHRCCNQIKSDLDLVIYNKITLQYEANIPAMRALLEGINQRASPFIDAAGKEHTEGLYDCADIQRKTAEEERKTAKAGDKSGRINIDAQLINLQREIQPLIDGINSNLQRFDDLELWTLFSKYKLCAAFSDIDFMITLLGKITGGEAADLLRKQNAAEEKKAAKEAKKLAKVKGTNPARLKVAADYITKTYAHRGGARYIQMGGEADEIALDILSKPIDGRKLESVFDLIFTTRTHQIYNDDGSTTIYITPFLMPATAIFASKRSGDARLEQYKYENYAALLSSISLIDGLTVLDKDGAIINKQQIITQAENDRIRQIGNTEFDISNDAEETEADAAGLAYNEEVFQIKQTSAGGPLQVGTEKRGVLATITGQLRDGILYCETEKGIFIIAPNLYIYTAVRSASGITLTDVLGQHNIMYNNDGTVSTEMPFSPPLTHTLVRTEECAYSAALNITFHIDGEYVEGNYCRDASEGGNSSSSSSAPRHGGAGGGFSSSSSSSSPGWVGTGNSASASSIFDSEAEMSKSNTGLPVFSLKPNGGVTNSQVSNATLCPGANFTNFTSPSGVMLKKCGDYFFGPNLMVYNSDGAVIGTHNIQFGGNRRLRKSRKRRDKIRHHSTRRRTGSSRKRGGSRKNR